MSTGIGIRKDIAEEWINEDKIEELTQGEQDRIKRKKKKQEIWLEKCK